MCIRDSAVTHPHWLGHRLVNRVDVLAEQGAGQKVKWRESRSGLARCEHVVGPQRFVDGLAPPSTLEKVSDDRRLGEAAIQRLTPWFCAEECMQPRLIERTAGRATARPRTVQTGRANQGKPSPCLLYTSRCV